MGIQRKSFAIDLSKLPNTVIISRHVANRPALREFLLKGREPIMYELVEALSYHEFVWDFIKTVPHLFLNQHSGSEKVLLNPALAHQPSVVGDALAADILTLQGDDTVVIDDADLVFDGEESAAFWTALVSSLHGSDKLLVINGRTHNLDIWGDVLSRGFAAIIDEHGVASPYGTLNMEQTVLEVKNFGLPEVYVDGHPIKPEQWQGDLVRNLFFLFINNPMITREEIFSNLWPDLEDKEATNVFHVTKRKLSEVLGFELTTYRAGFYRHVDTIQVVSDALIFDAAIKNEDWLAAIHWYQGEFLYEYKELPWMAPRREELKREYVQALIEQARIEWEKGDNDYALKYYLQSIAIATREDAFRAVMRIYAKKDERENFTRTYETLVQRLGRIKPDPRTRELWDTIRKEKNWK